MQTYKIDSIVKGTLLKENKSIHYYIPRAYLALEFLRSINFDSAYFIKKVVLTATDNKIAIPDDFVGLVRLGVKNGQRLERLGEDRSLIDNDETYNPDEQEVSGIVYWYPSVNKYGESFGSHFGYSAVSQRSYKVMLEENKILINNTVTAEDDEFYLEYHSDGMSTGTPYLESTNDVYIHPYAVDALIAYIKWKLSENGNRFTARELERKYYNQLRLYRARLSNLTDLDIKRSLRRYYFGSPKN